MEMFVLLLFFFSFSFLFCFAAPCVFYSPVLFQAEVPLRSYPIDLSHFLSDHLLPEKQKTENEEEEEEEERVF